MMARCRQFGVVGAPLAVALVAAMLAAASPGVAAADEHKSLEGKRVLFLVGEGFHDGETFFPLGYLTSRGATITIAGVSPGKVDAYNSDASIHVEKSVEDLSADDYDSLVIPGGRSPGHLREFENVVEFAKTFFETDKPVAAICHGPQVLVTADVLDGYKSSGVAGIRGELEGAGATYHDEAVIRDRNLITSRLPGDLPEFSRAIEKALTE